ncbi:MAG TPA: glycosyltransferase family 4 protein [Leptolyngbyaceae cyanobacterium]
MCSQASRLKSLPNLLLLKLLNPHAKIIVREHHYSQDYEQFHVFSLNRFHLMLKLTYSLADRVVAVSQAQGEWMLRNHLVWPNKLAVIRQCLLLKGFLAIASKPIKTPLVLAAYGRVSSQKGFDILLQAMKLIPHLPIKLRIGGEGSQIEELKQLAQGLENIEFVGCVDDVPKFLQASDVVVIPSRWEPWGNVCLEAKAAGKPVIASNVDGLTEQVQNCGLLIPPNNPEVLAEAIEQVVSLPQTQLQTWGSNGRESVRGAWDRYLSQWRTLLWEVLEK